MVFKEIGDTMKNAYETGTFKDHEAALKQETEAAELQLANAVTSKDRSAAKARLKTKLLQSGRMRDLSTSYFTMWQLVHLLADAEGTLWTPEEAALWNLEVQTYEGRGEKSLRHRYRDSVSQVASQGSCDLKEINEEIKNWQGDASLPGDGPVCKRTIQSIRAGKAGKNAYARLHREIVRQHDDAEMPMELWDALAVGELSPRKLHKDLPHGIKLNIQYYLSPSIIMGGYDAVNGVSELGFLRIPRSDYNSAFSLTCITQMGPKYDLRKNYVRDRLCATFDAQAAVA